MRAATRWIGPCVAAWGRATPEASAPFPPWPRCTWRLCRICWPCVATDNNDARCRGYVPVALPRTRPTRSGPMKRSRFGCVTGSMRNGRGFLCFIRQWIVVFVYKKTKKNKYWFLSLVYFNTKRINSKIVVFVFI